MAPGHISSSRSHSDKIPTATPIFSRSSFLVVVLLMLWDVDVCKKSKAAAKLPEVLITLLVLQIHMSFQKKNIICTKHLNLQRSWPTLPGIENPSWDQVTGSTNISKAMTCIIRMPTANLIYGIRL